MEKRYYWLKLKEDFFRDLKIKKLRKIAGGDTYTIIYLKMQLLSLKNQGVLEYQKVENSFEEEIALEIDEDIDNVKVTIAYLMQNGLLEEIEDNQFVLSEALKCIDSETKGASRVRKFREIKKQNDVKALQCNTDVTNCNKSVTTDIDIDIEKDIELDKEIEKKEINKEKKLSDAQEIKNLIENEFDNNQELLNAFNDFLKMRISKKAKNTAYAIKLLLNKLNQMALNDNEKLEIINQSIINGWQGLFPLKKNNYNNYNQQQEFDFTSKSDPNDFRKVSQEEQDEIQRRCDELGL